jgi:DNA-binding response OmpR family regulator
MAAAEYRPTVALIDIGLPGMSGYDVAAEIRKASGTQIVLIAVTGYGQDEDRRRAREAGFDEHMIKPVPFDVLEKRLAALSAGRTA